MYNQFVTIIVLNYNNYNDTIECIKSLKQINYTNYEILVIDNASSNNSYNILKEKFSDLQIYKTKKNLGFTGGINFGINQALEMKQQYILVLNNDTIVEKDFLTHLVETMQIFPDAAAVGGLILAEHDRKTIWYAGGKLIPWRGIAKHHFKNSKIDDYHENLIHPVTFISGCMTLLRTEFLRIIGLRDDRFFLHLEDIEYSARILAKGYKLIYNPRSRIYHKIIGDDKCKDL